MHYAIKTMKSQDKPLHILYVITQGVWGGAQRSVFDLAKSLVGTHAITVAIGEPHGAQDLQEALKRENPSIEVIQLQHLRRSISPFQDSQALLELKKLYKKVNPDIIHLHSSKAGVLGSIASGPQWKTVYTVHGWVFLEPLSKVHTQLYRILEKFTARFKDALILLSEKEKNIAEKELLIPQSKLRIIAPGIEPVQLLSKENARREIQKNISLPQNTSHWVGTIAGLYKTKGIDFLIETIDTFQSKFPPHTIFVVIGEGPEEQNLRKKIQALGLDDKIFLIGKKDNAAELLLAFDIFVLPSRKEGMPYTLLEAMQANLPVVATDVGGISSLLEHFSPHTVVPANDSQALMLAIVEMLTKSGSLPSYSSSAFEKMIRATTTLYQSLLSE